ncbi:hypothetical protein PF008_g24238 [Phytophthora fragariae]|uniref:Reverse transcriptase domain-containing protein n=1 Tax=Phytophthora fragariae TaxID=53985 RepID=A0A6G0QNM6_9STRA|nr:hypothetical protein PF008_g24238 [Phytophthora fragariae]
MLQRLYSDAEQRDEEKAAVSVATVRPAMAAARYVYAKMDDHDESGEQGAVRKTGEGARTSVSNPGNDPNGEGRLGGKAESRRMTTSESTEKGVEEIHEEEMRECASATAGATDSAMTMAVASRSPTTEARNSAATPTPIAATRPDDSAGESDATKVADVKATPQAAGDASTVEALSLSAGQLSAETEKTPQAADEAIGQIRLARRKARKQAKRQRVKRALVKRKGREQAEEAERRCCVEMESEERRQKADEALQEAERRSGRQARITGRSSEAVRVSLVQRRHVEQGGQKSEEDDTAASVEADDGLPTATVGERRHIKLDSCARYTIAGTEWMQYGDKVCGRAPVDYVEGIGGVLLDVIGVWHFKLRSSFDEVIEIDACIVAGCTTEFLVGVDFMRAHGDVMNFQKSEFRYRDKGRAVVVPFRTYDKEGGARVAAVRMLRKTELGGRTVTPVAIAVPAEDGERGVFLPTKLTGAVMLAATVTTAKGGYAWVPAVNSYDKPMRLPSKKELGTWVPLDDDTTVMSMDHEASSDELEQWVDGLGDSETPLECEDVIEVGEPSARALITKLLRVYRKLTRNTGDCPPATALDLQHHIDTGSAGPIMLKRRRNAQMEDKVIEDNVDKMLKAGVIEEGNGAWGFPVVLVRKKDGEVRFCVDYRALNDVTKKYVYPLPRIDETSEALGGALWFTTLDLRAGYWQILVAEDDKDKTAFTTKQGLYRFVRMPFGLTNAPSTFQRMMNSVLRGLT